MTDFVCLTSASGPTGCTGRWSAVDPQETLVVPKEGGIGLALLPCFLGNRAEELQRVSPLPDELSVGL
jgi:hypothetical protein